MTLTGLATPLLGMVDTFVMGHLEAAYYLGAVAVGSTLIQLLFWGVGFLRMSTTALAAQASHDSNKTRLVLLRSLVSAVLISTVVVLLREPLQHISYTLLALEQEINLHSQLYFEICIWSMPAVLLNMVIWGWCLGMQNARAPLYLALWINVVNMVLDVVLVFYFGLQTRGVAYAFLVANYSGLLLGVWILRHMLRPMPRMMMNGLWDAPAWKNLFAVNHHLFVRTILLLFSFAFFMAQGAGFGAVVLAANAVLINFFYITAYGMDGFAHGLEVLCGRAVGTRDRQLFERVIASALVLVRADRDFADRLFRGGRDSHHRLAYLAARGPERGIGLPVLAYRIARVLPAAFPDGRVVHRHDPHPRDAQQHGLVDRSLSGNLVCHAELGKPWIVARADRFYGRTQLDARVLQLADRAWRRVCSKRFAGFLKPGHPVLFRMYIAHNRRVSLGIKITSFTE